MNTVLVATERDLEQNLLAQALDGQGYHIIRSRDGLDALEAARSKAPQVLLINVALPKLDGFALYRRFQQDEQLRRIPIVLFSTRSNDQKSERFALELGAPRFVGNALKPGALDGVIEAALTAEPTPPLPVVELLKKPTPAEAVTSEASASDNVVTIDRTIKLPALIAAPDTEHIAQLQLQQAELQHALQQAQQQLAGAQAWQKLFAASPVAMWIINKATQKILAVNDAALRLFAYSHDEFMHLDSPALLRDQGQATATNVFAFRSKEGKALSLLVNSCELAFEEQPAEAWLAHDVSYRVRGERALADEVQRVKTQLAALPVAYWVINADAQLREANATCCQLLGYNREQLLQQGMASLLVDPQQISALLTLTPGQLQSVSMRYGDGSVHAVEVTAGQNELGAGQRLFMLQAERAPVTVEVPVLSAPIVPKLPAVLEMLRYAEDADEKTLLQYAMAQLAHAFESPLALFASLERVTQTLDMFAINHAQANRRITNNSIAVPAPWRGLLTPHTVCASDVPDEALLVDGLPEISSYAACSAGNGRELWLLAIANRDKAYTASEQHELQECAEILVAVLARKRQQFKLQSMVQRSAAATESTLDVLERLLEQHDTYAAGSGRRIASLAVELGRQLVLSTEQQAALTLAARLHDVGHLLLPQSLLLKPAALTPTERALMQTHVELGVQQLRGIDFGFDVAGIVAQHHERLDGSGYPLGLRGEQISMQARILGVADALEAMSSARAYRPALSVQAALMELQQAGGVYDATVLTACERLFAVNEGRWPI